MGYAEDRLAVEREALKMRHNQSLVQRDSWMREIEKAQRLCEKIDLEMKDLEFQVMELDTAINYLRRPKPRR